MTLQEIFDYVNIVLAKDQNGNTLSPPQYNNLLNAINEELFEYYYKEYAKITQAPIDFQRRLLASSPLSRLVTNVSSVNTVGMLVNGNVAMPTNARYIAAAIATREDKRHNVDVYHDEMTFAVVTNSLLHRDITTNPVAVQRNRVWEFLPRDISGVDIAYFRNPATPYYDTAIDANDNTLYLKTGYKLTAKATESHFDVAFDNGVAEVQIANNVFYDAQNILNSQFAVGTILDCLTVEPEWDRPLHIIFANRILERMGINIRDEMAYKYTQIKNAEGAVS